jgi:hypothetical protein
VTGGDEEAIGRGIADGDAMDVEEEGDEWEEEDDPAVLRQSFGLMLRCVVVWGGLGLEGHGSLHTHARMPCWLGHLALRSDRHVDA